MGYKPFYIRKQKAGASTFDSSKKWGLYCAEFPFRIFGDIKDLPSNNWADRDGVDEYVPDVLPIKAYDIEAKFVCKGKKAEVQKNVADFLKYLTGRDAENTLDKSSYGSEFMIYDTHTDIGRQHCRLAKIDDDAYISECVSSDLGVVEHINISFKLTIRVNDPSTEITKKDMMIV